MGRHRADPPARTDRSRPRPPSQVGPPAAQGETRARRSYLSVDKLVTKPHADIVVLADVLKYAVQHFPQQKALGWRDTIRMVEEEKEVVKDGVKEMKKWSYFELSEYKWWTYSELAEVVKQASSALVETGHTK
jgi:long-chain acyl-CoA synthetase